jgi:hypothetical protein
VSTQPPRPWPDDAPSIKWQGVTLIAKDGRDLTWATSITDKRELVKSSRGPLWAVWTGQYSSHLFTVPRKQAITELGVAA